MKAITASVLVLSIFSSLHARGQYIKAGNYSSDDIYVDLVPDALLATLLYQNGYQELQLDLNADGTPDLGFRASSYSNNGGFGTYIEAFSLDPHTAIAISDGLFPGSNQLVHLADTIDIDSLINDQLDYAYGYAVLDALGTSVEIVEAWVGIGEHFIGVSITSNTWGTLYGWVRVALTSQGSSRTLTVMDHACTTGEGKVYSVDPSPFSDQFTVIAAGPDPVELSVTDPAGRSVLRTLCSGRTTVPTATWNAGLYLYELRKNGELVKQGKLVKN